MQGHIGYRTPPTKTGCKRATGVNVPVRPTCQSIFSTVVSAIWQEIYKLLPNVVHDLKTQLLLLFKASTLITIPSISTLRSDVLVEFVHSVAELLQSMHKKLTFSNFKTKLVNQCKLSCMVAKP
jgi:hypothetical protein